MRTQSTFRLALLGLAVSLIAGCATPPPPAAEPAPVPAPETAPAPAPVPAAEVPPPREPAPAPVVPSGPVSPALQQQAQRQALSAVEMLEGGNEDQARNEIQAALSTDPNNKLAQSLQRQLTVDPVEALGRESFAYTVRPADTLSRIAGRFLGDIYSFYLLARYNDIKVPRLVAAGQVIRIPGKAPPPGADRDPPRPATAAPSPAPAAPVAPVPPPAAATPATPAAAEPTPGQRALRAGEAAERAGDLDRALAEYNRAAGLDQPQAAGKAGEVRRKLVQKHTQIARAAMARQDLDASIRNWDRVLELDAGNDTARLERQRAVTLKDRLKGLGK